MTREELVKLVRAEVAKVTDDNDKIDFLGYILDELDLDYIKLWDSTEPEELDEPMDVLEEKDVA